MDLLSFYDIKFRVTYWETSPPNNFICGCYGSPQDEQLKHQYHTGAHIWTGWTDCEYTLVNLEKEILNLKYSNILTCNKPYLMLTTIPERKDMNKVRPKKKVGKT